MWIPFLIEQGTGLALKTRLLPNRNYGNEEAHVDKRKAVGMTNGGSCVE